MLNGSLATTNTTLVRRWLTAIGLLVTAEELAKRGDGAASSTAVIAADSACEAVLGILGSWSTLGLKPEPKYHELLERAVDAATRAGVTLEVALLTDLRTTHATRNTVMHHGATGTTAQAQLGCRCARRLLDILPEVSTVFGVLQPGMGIVAAIASLIDAPGLAEQLTLGEQALAVGEASEAADAASRAHTALLFRLDPPIGRTHPGRLSPFEGQELGRSRTYLEKLGETVTELQGWVSASALGMDPVTYRRLRTTLGYHTQYLGGNDSIQRGHEPSLEGARLALVTVAEMTFRLWQLGGLIEGTEDDVFNRRYGVHS